MSAESPAPNPIADQLLALARQRAGVLHPVTVDGMPEGSCFSKPLSVDARSDMEAELIGDGGTFNPSEQPGKFRATLIKYTAADAHGNLLFADLPIEEIASLPAGILEPFVEAGLALNRFSAADADQLKKK